MEKVIEKVYCNYCDSMLGFFDEGVLIVNSRNTCYTRITNNNHTVKCRKCSTLTTFSILDNELEKKTDNKLRSKLLMKQK